MPQPLTHPPHPARAPRRYAEAEKTNGRWAMAGVVGILGQEALGVTPKWFEAGAKEYPIDFLPLLALEFAFMGFFELKRYQGFKNTGSVRATRAAIVSRRALLRLRPPVHPCRRWMSARVRQRAD
jgi:Chlorophyll A-B binding protein